MQTSNDDNRKFLGVLDTAAAGALLMSFPWLKSGSSGTSGRRLFVDMSEYAEATAPQKTVFGHAISKHRELADVWDSLISGSKTVRKAHLSSGITDQACQSCKGTSRWWETEAAKVEYRTAILAMARQIGNLPIDRHLGLPVEGDARLGSFFEDGGSLRRGSGSSGVLYVGGGRYWPMIQVGILMLRSAGYDGRIEVWYRGDHESVDLSWASSPSQNVHMFDINQILRNIGASQDPGGWEAKLWAIRLTSMETILYLDADAYCVADPKQTLQYFRGTNSPFGFWKDLPQNVLSVKWDSVYPKGSSGNVPQIQGGQLLINKPSANRIIELAHWMNQHSEFYFKHVYGDQDTWRVAITVLIDMGHVNPSDILCFGDAEWSKRVFICHQPDPTAEAWDTLGSFSHQPTTDTLIIHRCQSKLWSLEDLPRKYVNGQNLPHNQPFYYLPREAELFTFLDEVLPEVRPGRAFQIIYDKMIWGIGSGSGSNADEAEPYITHVTRLIADCSAAPPKIVDLGSGDGKVIKEIHDRLSSESLEPIIYGIDCSAKQVADLRQSLDTCQEPKPEMMFFELDFISEIDSLPGCDWLLCKDVLHHLPIGVLFDFLISLTKRLCSQTEDKTSRWISNVLFCCDWDDDPDHRITGFASCPMGGYRPLSAEIVKALNHEITLTSVRTSYRFELEVVKTFANKAILELVRTIQ